MSDMLTGLHEDEKPLEQQARIAALEAQLQGAQNEAATVRRNYLHEKAEREKAEARLAELAHAAQREVGTIREGYDVFQELLAQHEERGEEVDELRAQLAEKEGQISLWKETFQDEIAANLRISDRIGITEAIKAGMAYEDAEIAAFENLQRVNRGLEKALANSTELLEAIPDDEIAENWDDRLGWQIAENETAIAASRESKEASAPTNG